MSLFSPNYKKLLAQVEREREEHRKKIEDMKAQLGVKFSNPRMAHMLPASLTSPEPLGLSFQTEPIVGYRVWGFVNYKTLSGEHEARLRCVGSHGTWPGYRRMEALCTRAHHDAPQVNCTCGMWSLKERDAVRHYATQYMAVVYGEVHLWGRVLRTAIGYRAQYAYPKALYLYRGSPYVRDDEFDKMLASLSDTYGVPVHEEKFPALGTPANSPRSVVYSPTLQHYGIGSATGTYTAHANVYTTSVGPSVQVTFRNSSGGSQQGIRGE